MHVYTPPGYERSADGIRCSICCTAPATATTRGRRSAAPGFILDNLIAAKKAKPMIVVMPAGHTRRGAAAAGSGRDRPIGDRRFVRRLREGRHAVRREELSRADRPSEHARLPACRWAAARRCTRDSDLDQFAYIGVYSSGLLGAFPAPADAAAHLRPPGRSSPAAADRSGLGEEHQATLDNARLKKGLKLFWFATGKDDFLLQTTSRRSSCSRSTASRRCSRRQRADTRGSTGATTSTSSRRSCFQ